MVQKHRVGIWGLSRASGRNKRETLLEKRIENTPRISLSSREAVRRSWCSRPWHPEETWCQAKRHRLCEHTDQAPRPIYAGWVTSGNRQDLSEPASSSRKCDGDPHHVGVLWGLNEGLFIKPPGWRLAHSTLSIQDNLPPIHLISL